jgi:MFS family permease
MWTLLRRRNFALLWTGGLISLAGDWVLFVGLPLYVYDRTGSTLATGAMFLARLVPEMLLASVAGVFVDRWDRRRTLVIANLLLGAALLPVLLGAATGMLWIVYAASLLAATLAQFVAPAEDALLPRLVDERDLVPANALNDLNNNLARLIGPPLGGILYTVLGFGGVVIVDALSFLVAALCIAGVRVDARPQPLPGATHVSEVVATRWLALWREWLAGLGLVRTARPVAVLILFAALTGFGEGVLSTLFVPFVRTMLDGGDLAYGVILSAQAVGGLLGGVVVAHTGRSIRPAWLWGGGALGLALVDLAIFTTPVVIPGIALTVLLMIVVGVPVAGLRVGLATVRQTAVADAYRGRLMGAFLTTNALTMAAGTIITGVLGERVALLPLLTAQVVSYGLAGILVLVLLRAEHSPETATRASAGVSAVSDA